MSSATLRESLLFARRMLQLQGVRRPSADKLVRDVFPEPERRLWEQLDEEERDAISAVYDDPGEDLTEEVDRETTLAHLLASPDPEDRLQ